MPFKSDRQRKKVMSLLSRFKQLPQQYHAFQHKREIKAEHKLAKEEKETEAELTKEQSAMEKQLAFEKRRMQLQKEREELAKLKHERFAMSPTGRFLSKAGEYAKTGLQQVQRATQESEPRRTYKHKVKRQKRESDDEITFGSD
jgi:hypothetical protein